MPGEHLRLPDAWAMAHPDNSGSKRVLEKAVLSSLGIFPREAGPCFADTDRPSHIPTQAKQHRYVVTDAYVIEKT